MASSVAVSGRQLTILLLNGVTDVLVAWEYGRPPMWLTRAGTFIVTGVGISLQSGRVNASIDG
jgi:hypothetical protein